MNKILLVSLVIILALAGVLVWQNWLKPVPVVNNNQTLVSDATANWETYKNDQYRFEIKYPSDWKIKEDIGTHEARFDSPRVLKAPLNEIFIETGVFPHGTEGAVDTKNCISVNSSYGNFDRKAMVEEKIGETNFCKIIIESSNESGKIGILGTRYVAVKDNFDYTITLWVSGGTLHNYLDDSKFQYELDIFKQILSTFKFTK